MPLDTSHLKNCYCKRATHVVQSDKLRRHPELVHLMANNPLPQSLPRGREVKKLASPFTLHSHSSLKHKAAFTLAEGATHVAHSNNTRRAAFTLAEVLITLGIIGVVAAMTIPSIVANYQEIVLQKQFLKSYNTLQTAYKPLENKLGYTPECYYPNYTGSTGQGDRTCRMVKDELKKILSVVKECNGNAISGGCVPQYKSAEEIYIDKNPDATDDEIANASNGCQCFATSSGLDSNLAWVLADGTTLMWCLKGSYPLFAIDINGKKGPNKWGYDLFQFGISSSDGNNLKVDPNIGCGRNTIEKGGKTSKKMLLECYK